MSNDSTATFLSTVLQVMRSLRLHCRCDRNTMIRSLRCLTNSGEYRKSASPAITGADGAE